MDDRSVLKLDFDVQFPKKRYKNFLNKIQQFIRYSATVGVHASEGKKKVVRKYINTSGKSKIAGKSNTMTIAKLVYQNEYGASIRIKPRYKDAKRTTSKTYNTFKQRITVRTIEHYSALRGAREQGFLLLDKQGNFVMYKKPGSTIRIPKRPFLQPIVQNPQPEMINNITKILTRLLYETGLTSRQAMVAIAKIVNNKVKENIHKNSKPNHPITVQAKGFNRPLTDEQDRIYKAIKYKIYKDKDVMAMQPVIQLEKLKKSADQYTNKGIFKTEQKTLSFTYKGFNPNFMN